MNPFYNQFNSPDVLRNLEAEEIAFLILDFIKNRRVGQNDLHIQIMNADPREQPDFRACQSVIAEGWNWLENHGLLIPREGGNGLNGWRLLSRKAERITNEADFQAFRYSQALSREILHEQIRERVWGDFVRGNFDAGVMHAFRTLEVYVREVAGYDNAAHGLGLFQDAFRIAKNDNPPGPLTDQTLEPSEQEGQRNLFLGAYSYYRNPNAHRNVDIASADSALEIILLANQLLRIVDAAKDRIAAEMAT